MGVSKHSSKAKQQKKQTFYVCQECGLLSPYLQYTCEGCGYEFHREPPLRPFFSRAKGFGRPFSLRSFVTVVVIVFCMSVAVLVTRGSYQGEISAAYDDGYSKGVDYAANDAYDRGYRAGAKSRDAEVTSAEQLAKERLAEVRDAEQLAEKRRQYILDTWFELSFMRNNAAIVLTSGGKYHHYGCQHIRDKSYYIYNTELAEYKGYSPCSDCWADGLLLSLLPPLLTSDS